MICPIVRRIIAAAAACFLIISCEKNRNDSREPTEPVRYAIEVDDFQTSREGLRIGGKIYSPKGLEGEKPAVIFCHGLTGSYRDGEAYARAAARTGLLSCIFDFCGGHEGESLSGGKRADDSILTELDDLSAVYNEIAARPDVDPSRIAVMGGSQGGLVVAMFAARNPEKTKALGLLFPAFNIPQIVRMYTLMEYGGLDNVPETINYSGFTVWRKYVVDAYNIYPYGIIGLYEGPVTIIHGDKDEIVPLSYSKTALKKYKNASLTVLEGQNHGFDADGQAKAIGLMEDFLVAELSR